MFSHINTVFSDAFFSDFKWETLRIPGVLQRFSLTYFIAAMIVFLLQPSPQKFSLVLNFLPRTFMPLFGILSL